MKSLQRTSKRLLILLIGVILAYTAEDIYPFIHRRLHIIIIALVIYLLLSYLVIPSLIRLYRIMIPPHHLPVYSITPDGFASDPINVAIIGSRRDVISAMESAGWHQADPRYIHYLLRYVYAMFFRRHYKSAPLSNLYLFGRKQDLGFESLIGSVQERHHVRFWATSYDPTKPLELQHISWRNRRAHEVSDHLVWVGAASKDIGLAFIRHNMQITHMIHPDTNQERELIVSSLEAAGQVAKTETIKLWNPYKLINRAWRGYLLTDGKMTIIRLSEPNWLAGTKDKAPLRQSLQSPRSTTATD